MLYTESIDQSTSRVESCPVLFLHLLRRRRFGRDARAVLGFAVSLERCPFKRSTSISRLPSISRFASRSCSRRDVTSKYMSFLLLFLFRLLLLVDDDIDADADADAAGCFLTMVQNSSSSARSRFDSLIFCQLSSSDSTTEFASDL